jgi:uncharacterized protein involved in exopolysaccharide biosynthesis
MIRKILEACFRHKLLVVLPPILIPVIVTPIALMLLPAQFDSSASIWVDRPSYLDFKDTSNPYQSPVQTQSSRLSDLLHTRAFVDDVASRTSLAPLVGSVSGEERISELISRGVTIGATSDAHAAASDHLLVLHVQASSAQLAYELCTAIVNAYQDKNTADLSDQASVAVDFYQSRLQDAQQNLNQASQNLRRYVAARQASDDGATDPTQGNLPATLLDPKLGELQSSFQQAQAGVNSAQTTLTQAQRDASASAQGQQLGFQVLDPPQLATIATPQFKKIIIYPIAALVVGLGLSALLVVLLVAGDRSIRSESDLSGHFRVLGTVPMLELKRLPKDLRAVGTRRAMGARAGTALPAPILGAES